MSNIILLLSRSITKITLHFIQWKICYFLSIKCHTNATSVHSVQVQVELSCSHSPKQRTDSGGHAGFLLLALQSLLREWEKKRDEVCFPDHILLASYYSSHLTPASSRKLPRACTWAEVRVTVAVKLFVLADTVCLVSCDNMGKELLSASVAMMQKERSVQSF